VLATVDGLDPAEWTPHELRHSFILLLSDSGIPIEEISRLVGYSSTTGYRAGLSPPDSAGDPGPSDRDGCSTRTDAKIS
jgi:integrase